MATSNPPIQTNITIEDITCKRDDSSCVRRQINALKARHKKTVDRLKSGKGFKKVSIYLDSWVQRNFKTEGGLIGGWKKSQAAQARHGKTLQDSGRLRASFIPFASALNAGIGSSLEYSEKHDKGLEGNIQRRILPKKNEVIGKAKEILKQHVEDSLND